VSTPAGTATAGTTAAGVSTAAATDDDNTSNATAGATADRLTAETAAVDNTAAVRAKLLAFYKQHNPEKVGEVDTILQRYAGRTDAMFAKLYAKYGVADDVTGDVADDVSTQQLTQSDNSTAVRLAEQTSAAQRNVVWFWRIEASTRCSIGVEQPADTGEHTYYYIEPALHSISRLHSVYNQRKALILLCCISSMYDKGSTSACLKHCLLPARSVVSESNPVVYFASL
jgi:hypothetical protein